MNLDIYTSEMSKSVWDKSFFMDKIPGAKCIIDFGCADGAMIKYLAPLFPDITFIGYDISEDLINRARADALSYANTAFFKDYRHMISFVNSQYKADEICINFSSVLHEVFSSTPSGRTSIPIIVQLLQPKYITIRDMYFHWGDTAFVYDSPYSKIDKILTSNNIRLDAIEAFEEKDHHLIISGWKTLSHFLMKYQWINNGWENELEENYFSWTIDDFLQLINNKYNVTFETHYQLPYLTETWKKQYNIYMPKMHTHAQFILRRND